MEKEMQRKEALKRMKLLKFPCEILRKMEEGCIYKSVHNVKQDLEEKEIEMVKDWEKTSGNLVYHLIYNNFEFGRCYTFLFVSTYPEEWEDEMNVLKNGMACAYVKNLDVEDFSEYGLVAIEPYANGIKRIG